MLEETIVEEVELSSQTKMTSLVKPRISLLPDQRVEEVGKLFLENYALHALAIVDKDRVPVGIVHRYQLMDIFMTPYGRDLHGKKPIAYFMDSKPLVVEEDLPVEIGSQYITQNMQMPVAQDFIITHNNQYRGMGSVLDLLATITKLQVNHLKAENKRLSAEVEITHRLQQMLLPKPHELSSLADLEIAGFMEPAEEVGGDYYDVLEHEGLIKIGIGDVTGHGLESGVLALMVQTAVRTLMINKEQDPIKFLDTLNRTIYANIQRMEAEKELTLLLIDYYQQKLRISGQHEEIICIREGQVEQIDTTNLGFPIGLEEDVFNFLDYTEITLNPGDVVILYTDGITEAEDYEGRYYGLERLCQVACQHWQQPAHEIQQAIIHDVKQYIGNYQVLDDITLVIIKRREK